LIRVSQVLVAPILRIDYKQPPTTALSEPRLSKFFTAWLIHSEPPPKRKSTTRENLNAINQIAGETNCLEQGLLVYSDGTDNIGATKKDPPLRRAKDARERNWFVSPGDVCRREFTRYDRLNQPLSI